MVFYYLKILKNPSPHYEIVGLIFRQAAAGFFW